MSVDPDTLVQGGVAGTVVAVLHKIFTYDSQAFEVCHAKPIKEGRGFPWNKTVMVHNKGNGEFTMRFVQGEKSAAAPQEEVAKKKATRKKTSKKKKKS